MLVQTTQSMIYADALASSVSKLERARVQWSPKPISTYKHTCPNLSHVNVPSEEIKIAYKHLMTEAC